MNYQQTLDWMFAQLPMYQREGKTAFKKDLTNILLFSEVLNFPERKFKTIHVGGTNGKGSTSHMIGSILQEAGYKVGLYTSPHLKNFTERIRINGREIPKRKVTSFINKQKGFLEKQKLSFFEMTVGLAFDYFANEKVDIAIIEVGLGGRLDSTNIITPEIAVITNIGLDHTQFLGETLPEIAYEKAGIIKNKIPVVIGEKQTEVLDVFLEKAKECESEIYFASNDVKNYPLDLLGDYQRANSKTAVAAIQQLRGFTISEKNILDGLLHVVKNTSLKGRRQVLQENPK
ncbi:MAG: Mur ligase family protein, partial [Polaribacter sp.]|nr:Mur ligase family protein [Polaribacter sp.]